jgi:hypothetical protein
MKHDARRFLFVLAVVTSGMFGAASAQSGDAGRIDEDQIRAAARAVGPKLAETLRGLTPQGRVVTLGLLARSRGRNDTGSMARLFFADPAVADFGLPGLKAVEAEVIWRYFFLTADTRPAQLQGQRAVIGYYSPFVALWLLTEWDMSSKIPRIVDMTLTTSALLAGEAISEGDIEATPQWFESWREEGLAAAFAAESARAAAAFAASLGQRSDRDAPLPQPKVNPLFLKATLRNRAAALLTSIAQLNDAPRRLAAAAQVIGAVELGDADSLRAIAGDGGEAVLIDEVLSIDQMARLGLSAYAALPLDDGVVVIAGSALTPRVAVVVGLNDGSSQPELSLLAAFDAMGGR